MRLAIRFSPARGLKSGSQNTVAAGLIPELAKLHGDVVLFTSNPEAFSGIRGLEIRPTMALGLSRSIGGTMLERLRDQLTFESQLRRHRCDVVYYPFTHESILATLTVPQVITVHDLIPVIYPEDFPLMARQWKYFTFPALRLARAIITPSTHTKEDLVRVAGIRPGKIHVVPQGFPPRCQSAGAGPSVMHGPYILYVSSSRYPYKNIGGLCEAFARIRDRIPHSLVVVGKSVPRFAAEQSSSIAGLKLGERLRLLEELDEEQLVSLYAGADLFAYPSKYEGFGTPPLEAMSYGVPVVASNVAPIPEVCGGAAHYFDPHSVEAIADAIMAGISDRELRRALQANAVERMKMFEWRYTAAGVLRVCHLAWGGVCSPAAS